MTQTDYHRAVERRKMLQGLPSPHFGSDYMIALDDDALSDGAGGWRIDLKIRYVPDQVILDIASFEIYMRHIRQVNWESLEQVTSSVIDDFNNELVPCWIQVMATGSIGQEKQGIKHRVFCEDKQPQWKNTSLLASLGNHWF